MAYSNKFKAKLDSNDNYNNITNNNNNNIDNRRSIVIDGNNVCIT